MGVLQANGSLRRPPGGEKEGEAKGDIFGEMKKVR
jgi:hypothetical protein